MIMTKEQFSVNLYDAIFLIGQLDAKRHSLQLLKERGFTYGVKAVEKELDMLRGQFFSHSKTLTDLEVNQLLREYPWLLNL